MTEQLELHILFIVKNPYFDGYAVSYDEDLGKALSVSGEDKNFFANGRMLWLADWLGRKGKPTRTVLDFGCGTGSATPFIWKHLRPNSVLGTDISDESLQVARNSYGETGAEFELTGQPRAKAFDVAFCNGVFHHIPPDGRQEALRYIFDSLEDGGVFALFENNPWNPATRYVMSRCVFDVDAITLSPVEARQRMENAGFKVQATRFLFVFPAALKVFRWMEKPLSPMPFGTQYVVIGMK
ncbi:MAG: class I SAM-dependent DNA methyltransferase [Verrucomicrobiales bacterium]